MPPTALLLCATLLLDTVDGRTAPQRPSLHARSTGLTGRESGFAVRVADPVDHVVRLRGGAALPLSGYSLVYFFNTVLSLGCSLCILIGLWPFRGLFHAWFYVRYPFSWNVHTMMAWFDVGCWGLFATNLQSLLTFTSSTSPEALKTVCVTNALMHFLWGAHNLHLGVRGLRGVDAGTVDEWRRPSVILLWSLLGACGTGAVRNLYTVVAGPSDALTLATAAWEWLCLGAILADFGYFLVKEHTWGMAMQHKA